MKKFLFTFIVCTISCFFAEAKQEVHFSSCESLKNILVERINKENLSIKAAVFIMTEPSIGKALLEAKKRGADIELVIDYSNAHKNKTLQDLIDAGIKVYLWRPVDKQKRGVMHHKFCIFHHKVLWNGSFNFTQAANLYHRENVIIMDDKLSISLFEQEFERIKKESILQNKSLH